MNSVKDLRLLFELTDLIAPKKDSKAREFSEQEIDNILNALCAYKGIPIIPDDAYSDSQYPK